MTAHTGEIELPRARPIAHRRGPTRLACRLGPLSRHEWLRINGRYRCLHCSVLRHPD